jgi:hypothetical protein
MLTKKPIRPYASMPSTWMYTGTNSNAIKATTPLEARLLMTFREIEVGGADPGDIRSRRR